MSENRDFGLSVGSMQALWREAHDAILAGEPIVIKYIQTKREIPLLVEQIENLINAAKGIFLVAAHEKGRTEVAAVFELAHFEIFLEKAGGMFNIKDRPELTLNRDCSGLHGTAQAGGSHYNA